MAVSISVVQVVVYALVISGVLVWLNSRGTGAVGAAAGTMAACVALGTIELVAYGQAALSRQSVQLWLWFLLLPAALVLGVSRLGWVRTSPAWLLLLGPLLFVFGVVLMMVTYNVLFASRETG